MTAIPWLKIIADYMNGETNLTALAKKYGVTRESISKKKARDAREGREWVSRQVIRDQVVTGVIDRVAAEIADDEGKLIAANLKRHATVETLLLDVTIETLRRVKHEEGTSPLRAGAYTSEADELKSVIDASVKALEASRKINGLEAGDPSVGEKQAGDDTFRIVWEDEPERVAESA